MGPRLLIVVVAVATDLTLFLHFLDEIVIFLLDFGKLARFFRILWFIVARKALLLT